ncbi:MAG: DUF933 domain-containing protein [Thermoguttaceae bacterium]
MNLGLIGYKGSGKSLLFSWLTGVAADVSLAHKSQSAMAVIPEDRIEQLAAIYQPKKLTYASMEIVDTPGLERTGGNAQRLAQLREADSLVCVVGIFEGTTDPTKAIAAFREELVLADLEIVTTRLAKVTEQNRRPVSKAQHDLFELEIETLQLLQAGLESGKPLTRDDMTNEQHKVTSSFRLLTEKPQMVVFNTSDDETDLESYQRYATPSVPVVAVSVRLESELAAMSPDDAAALRSEMRLPTSDRATLLKLFLRVSQQQLFLTAGEKEVRTWLMPLGGTALDAADAIHTDMAKGFIRAEVMRCDDLIRLGSERELKAANLVRREAKDYIIQDGDILLFHFSG